MENKIRRTLAGHLWCLGLAVLAVAGVAGWLSVDASRQVSVRANDLVATHMPHLRVISELQDAVSRRVLHLYLYYATTDQNEWQKLRSTQAEYQELLGTIQLGDADAHQLQSHATAFNVHAQAFNDEMTKAPGRDWDVLREHLADAQIAADKLTHSLGDLADRIREQTREEGSMTLTELSRLSYVQRLVLAVLLLVGVLLTGLLRARSQDQAELYRRAYFDRLTHLPNRVRMEQDWKARIRGMENHPDKLAGTSSVLAIQLDRYQLLTSTFGHTYGNSIITALAARLSSVCADSDGLSKVYQFAAGAWLIVIDRTANTNTCVDSAREILALLNKPIRFDEHEVTVTCSAGITFFPEHGQTADALLRNCHSAMHRAQADGGNRLAIYDEWMHRKSERFLSVESAMRRSLKVGEFELFFQPKLYASDLSCAGAEALIRWRRDGKLVSPAEFIPVAEESGLILPLGQWVIDEACRQWMQWHSEGLSPPPVAVNVSAQQFQSPDFISGLSGTLAKTGMPAAMLELEITEEATFEDPQTVVAIMQAAKELGVSLALDDFGTGYSSLSCLTAFPLDVIKIDQKFVRELQTSERILAVVEVIVTLGRELGFKLVAEGVETEEQEAKLRVLGCDYLQGFRYFRPVPAQEYAQIFCDRARRKVQFLNVANGDSRLMVESQVQVPKMPIVNSSL